MYNPRTSCERMNSLSELRRTATKDYHLYDSLKADAKSKQNINIRNKLTVSWVQGFGKWGVITNRQEISF